MSVNVKLKIKFLSNVKKSIPIEVSWIDKRRCLKFSKNSYRFENVHVKLQELLLRSLKLFYRKFRGSTRDSRHSQL